MKKYLLSLVLFLSLLVVSADAGPPFTCPRASTTFAGCVQLDGTSITSTNGVISATTGGAGNVTGPASSTANDIVGFSGTTGKILQDSGILASNIQLITGLASPAAIGNTTPNSGAFTTLSATSTLSVGGAISGAGVTSLFASPPALGGTAPAAGAHTTLSVTGQFTSTLANGTAPFVVASSTQVSNLNVSQLIGATWAAPGTIGNTTPNTGAFTTLSATSSVSGNGFNNLFASPPALGGTAPAAITGTAVTGTSVDAKSGAYLTELPNEGVTGTTQFLLAKLTGAGTAIKATTSDTGGVVVGAVQSASAITGNAQIAVSGQATCTFDGATTQDDFVQVSGTIAGDCHDTGAGTYPTTGGQVIGRVLSTHGAGGNFAMMVIPPSIIPGAGSSTGQITEISKTTNYSLNTTTDVGAHFDNNGAAGAINFTLPTGANGLNYCFTTVGATQNITITAPAGIKIAVGEQNSGAAGILNLPSLFDSQCIKWVQFQWVAYMGQGSWTLQ